MLNKKVYQNTEEINNSKKFQSSLEKIVNLFDILKKLYLSI